MSAPRTLTSFRVSSREMTRAAYRAVVFTQTVAGHGGRPISQVFQHGQRGQVDRGHRRLQISGQGQFLQRSLEAQLPKGQVEQRFGPLKHLAGRGVLIVDFPAHAYILGTLPWK